MVKKKMNTKKFPSETGTETHKNVTETEKRKTYFGKVENALNVPYRYQASIICNSSEKSCMIGRASKKAKWPTITDDKMGKDESLPVARQAICEDHETIIENVSSNGCRHRRRRRKRTRIKTIMGSRERRCGSETAITYLT
jgi:hypothetical protein